MSERCPRCGGMLNDDNVCPLCGYKGKGISTKPSASEGFNNLESIYNSEVGVKEETTDNKVSETDAQNTYSYENQNVNYAYNDGGNDKKLSKAILIAAVLIILGVIAVIVFVVRGGFNGIGNKTVNESEFDAYYDTLFVDIYNNECVLEDICNKVYLIWDDAVSQYEEDETRKYTKDDKGNFYSDYNDALEKYFDSDEYETTAGDFFEVDEEIEECLQMVLNYTGDNEDKYNAILIFYSHYCEFYNLAFFDYNDLEEFYTTFCEIEDEFSDIYYTAYSYYSGYTA